MKKFILGLILLTGCAVKYITLSRQTLPKTTMVAVSAVVTQVVITTEKNKQVIHQSTVTVPFLGAGVLISPNGHILTCAHLFNKEVVITTVTLHNGIQLPASLIYQDVQKDLALLKISGHYTNYATLSKIPLQVGQEVLAIGNPVGLDFTVTHGIVSALNRSDGDEGPFTQIDAPINSGNSGGPLFNMGGELVGINARILPNRDGLALSISPEIIRAFLNLFQGLN